MRLQELFETYAAPQGRGTRFGTDKGSVGHHYGPTYEALFDPLRDVVTTLLEIGVDGGGSLAAWADYFPDATVWGLDISLNSWVFGRDHSRIRCLEANGVTYPLPAELPEVLDIVIDDGSHEAKDQLAALEIWGPRVRHFLVIEDVNLRKNPMLDAAFRWTADRLGLQYTLIDLRSSLPGQGQDDDVLAIFSPGTL